ncbi:MAG: AmmeMemoRadiSam system protein B [Candidatus Woesearchaeota archaeon]
MRLPVVAGQFYAEDNLDEQVKECFLHQLGPGSLPVARVSGFVKGIISPHAGFMFSGPCAAFGFKEIAESVKPDVFLVLGLSHSGLPTCFSADDWRTPLGVVKNDKDFVNFLSEKTGVPINERAHATEHSIEVQLPFLQFCVKKPIFAPLMVSHDLNPHELASSLKKAIADSKERVCIIASSDFTHYGINYGFIPFASNKKENLYKLDKGAIECILQLKSGKFLDYVDNTRATICGSLPIAVLLDLVQAEKAELLQYYTSGDINNDYSSAVGYASISFR